MAGRDAEQGVPGDTEMEGERRERKKRRETGGTPRKGQHTDSSKGRGPSSDATTGTPVNSCDNPPARVTVH